MSIFKKNKIIFYFFTKEEKQVTSWDEHSQDVTETQKPIKQAEEILSDNIEETVQESIEEIVEKTPMPSSPRIENLESLIPEPFEYNSKEFIKFGYYSGSETVYFTSSPESNWKWFSEYTKPEQTRPIKTWREENKIAAELLLEKHGDALAIFYDGSLASQITLLSFNDAGKIPRVYTVKFSDEEQKPNALTSLYASLSFPLRIIEMRGDDFWKTRGVEMVSWFNAISSSEAIKIWARTAAGGVPLFCSGLPYVQKFGTEWMMADHEQYFLLDTAVRSAKTTVIPAFFRYTPEQILSFLGQATEILDDLNEIDSFSNAGQLLKTWYPELIVDNQELSQFAKAHEIKTKNSINRFINICWHHIKKV